MARHLRPFVLVLASFAVAGISHLPAGDPQSDQWKAGSKLELANVIAGIDSLSLRSIDFAFDGGSLLFGFSLQPEMPEEVFVFLPNPHAGGTVNGNQMVVVSSHAHLSRYALAKASDPKFPIFLRLVTNAGIGSSNWNEKDELREGLEVIKKVLQSGAPPKVWGAEIFR